MKRGKPPDPDSPEARLDRIRCGLHPEIVAADRLPSGAQLHDDISWLVARYVHQEMLITKYEKQLESLRQVGTFTEQRDSRRDELVTLAAAAMRAGFAGDVAVEHALGAMQAIDAAERRQPGEQTKLALGEDS